MRGKTSMLLLMALSGCASLSVVPEPPDPWRQALQACQLPEQGLADAAAVLQVNDEGLCRRAAEFGEQLSCLSRRLPTLYEAHSRFTQSGLLEFQSCLQPMAVGLKAGRLGRPRDIDLALRACVLQLDRSPALPRVKPAWWYASYAATLPVPAAPSTLAAASLPPAIGLSWPSCEATAALKPVTSPIPATSAMPRAAPASSALRPAMVPPRARASENLSTNRERDEI
jgi:hypothetical protein